MALERMYELDRARIGFTLKSRAACFLESDTAGRGRVSDELGRLYRARSEIVHNSETALRSTSEREEFFRTGFDIARRTIIKQLRDGPPADWPGMVNAATGAARR